MTVPPALPSRPAPRASREWRLLMQLAVITVLTLSGGAIAGRWFGLDELARVQACQPGAACEVTRLEAPAAIVVRLASTERLPAPSAGALPSITRVVPNVERLTWEFIRPSAPASATRAERQRAPPLQAH